MMKISVVFSCIILTSLTLGYGQMQYENQSLFAVHSDSWFDSLNVRFVDNWPFARSQALAYCESGNFVALSSGGGVYIIDISNPSNPTKISEFIHTRGFVNALFYQESTHRLYIANGIAGIEIWDVSSPSAPLKLGSYNTRDDAQDIFVIDSFAYVVDRDEGLLIIDISDPIHPVLIGSCDTPGRACGVHVILPYAYVADTWAGLRLIDVSDPSMPYETGFCPAMVWTMDVYVIDTLAYVADFDEFFIVNISNPVNPMRIGGCWQAHHIHSVYIVNNLAYVVGQTHDLKVIDISDPADPCIIGSCGDFSGSCYDVYVLDSLAYIAGDVGLIVVDVSIPTNPHGIGLYKVDRGTRNIDIQDHYAYVAGGIDKLRIIDLSSASQPYEVGSCLVTQAIDIYLYDSYAYVVGGDDFSVVDISQPNNPYMVSTLQLSGYGYGIYVQNGYAYVACGTGGGGMYVIDISNPVLPYIVGFYNNPIRDVYVVESLAYVADVRTGTSYLRIVDISDPFYPQEISFCNVYGFASKVYVREPYVYVAAREGGLRIYDVSNPYSPVEVSWLLTSADVSGIVVDDIFAYLANTNAGLKVVDISDPTNPNEVGYYNTPGSAQDVTIHESLIYVADGSCGLQIYENLLTDVKEESLASIKNGGFNPTIFSGPLLLPTGKNCKVFDITGRIVMPDRIKPGIYFVEIDGVISHKVIKVK